MIDCHIHCGLGKTRLVKGSKNNCENVIEEMTRVIKIYKKMGITGLRDGGDSKGVGIVLRDISKDFDIDFRTPIRGFYKKGLYGNFLGQAIDDEKDGINKMSELFKETPDFIKIILTGIMSFTKYGVSGPIGFSKSESKALFDHAHQKGLSVMVHANTPKGIMRAIESGADTIEHGYGIDDDCLQGMYENNVIWVPTLAPFANIANCSDNNPMKKYKKVSEQYFKKHREQVKKADAMGVNIALGSDSCSTMVPFGFGTQNELSYLLDLGLTEEKLECIGRRVMKIS
jgi:imidazolonepropionase-like amidohydrolase